MTAQQYEIRVKGSPEFDWEARFEEVELLPSDGDEFVLRILIPDQPALYGLLSRIRAAGLVLISVELVPYEISPSN